MDIKKYRSRGKILLAVDCIIFGFDGREIKALLIKRGFVPEKGKWSLMGGFVNPDEHVEHAAARVLKELTGLTNIYMEQLFCFGDVNRDPAGRVVSVAYFALIKIEEYDGSLATAHEAHWFPLNKIPRLIFDHQQMVKMAKERLQQKAAHYPVGFELLPEKFTLPQLQSLYESIYETTLDRRNFTKKILSLNILIKQADKDKKSSRKGAFYFVFDHDKYNKLQQEGIRFL